jgi:3-hydroxyisobutyrate dehydrogenase
MQVAFLGTGLLGGAMAERFVRSGVNVRVWNRTAAKLEPIVHLGAHAAASPADAVQGATVVHLVLRDDASVNDTLDACGDALAAGTIIVDHTTVLPGGVLARAPQLAARGVHYLHAPVFMGPAAALSGGGSMYVSGPAEPFAVVQSHLGTMTGAVHYLGERPDLAAVYKLVGNTMIITINAGLADAFAIAQASGVSPVDAHALFTAFSPCATIAVRGKAMAEGDYRASFELAMARKDVQLMCDAAAAGQQSLHVMPAIAERMDTLLAAGHAHRDFNVLAVDTIPATIG